MSKFTVLENATTSHDKKMSALLNVLAAMRKGKTGVRLPENGEGAAGTWKDLTASMNFMASNLIQ